MSTILVDIDDTLMPWADTVHQACAEAGLHDGSKSYTSWQMWEDYGVEKEAWLEVVNGLVVPGGVYHTPPYPGEIEALRAMHFAGHEILLVTARGFMDHAEQIRAWTAEWVEEWAVPGELIFARDKDRVAIERGVAWAVDDGGHNYDMLDAVGVNVYLRNQPHNLSRDDIPPARRVNSVAEFCALVGAAEHWKPRYMLGVPS